MATSDGWIFEEGKPTTPDPFPDTSEPYLLLSTQDQWDNYSNRQAYDFEVRLRAFLQYMSEHSKYRAAKARRFTYTQILQRLYGESPDISRSHQDNVNREICAYYSSRLLEDTMINGKRCKRVYVLAYSRLKKRPWCIKLRMEYFMEHDIPLEPGRLRCIKKQIQWGHARNPRTDANMEKRRQDARRRYNERYNTREYKEYLKSVHDAEQ